MLRGTSRAPPSAVRLRSWARLVLIGQLVAAPLRAEPQPLQGTEEKKPTEMVRVSVRGFLIVNMNYNTAGIFPGSQAAFVLQPSISEPQFFISPQNSVVGIDLAAGPLYGAQIIGALAITLRSPQPLITTDTISPQFYDVHVELRKKTYYVAFGQMPDVVYPVTPDVVNTIPPGYLPGAIGYTRPQLQGGVDLPLSEELQLLLRGSLARPIQTFNVSGEFVGRQGGFPDFQGRIAVGTGEPVGGGATIRPRERPIEIGVDGHWGRRKITLLPPDLRTLSFSTWSLGGDFHVKLPTGTTVRGEIFTGSVLGDYQAGVFHTIDSNLLVGVRAWGFWAQVEQALGDRLRVAAAYGFDNPNTDDLSPVTRARNQAIVLTGFWDVNKWLTLGLEGSRWHTNFVGASANTAWRADVALIMGFGGS
jgi:hypothetical protein